MDAEGRAMQEQLPRGHSVTPELFYALNIAGNTLSPHPSLHTILSLNLMVVALITHYNTLFHVSHNHAVTYKHSRSHH